MCCRAGGNSELSPTENEFKVGRYRIDWSLAEENNKSQPDGPIKRVRPSQPQRHANIPCCSAHPYFVKAISPPENHVSPYFKKRKLVPGIYHPA